MPDAAYTIDWQLNMLEKTLADIETSMVEAGGVFELNPDFQRGHVWTDAQRTAFVEALIRKSVTGRILFNCPGWSRSQCGAGGTVHTTQEIERVRGLLAQAQPS